jgi:transposase
MPRKKLPMRKITEVLRLAAQGLSQRQIALSTAVSKTAVREYLSRAERAGVRWPLPEGMTAEALEAALFPRPVVVPAGERPVPDWRAVHKELKRKDCHMTLRLLWLEWKEANPNG